MATLPDLDPTQIGVIAFWNAHDHRVDPALGATIDPTDVLGVLKSYTLYDNGVDGLIDYGPAFDVNVRVKNDGWIIAWMDRTNYYAQNVFVDTYRSSGGLTHAKFPYKGYYHLMYPWTASTINELTSNTNTLIEIIGYLYNQLSNAADFNFIKSDVGVYCYEFTDVNTITMASYVHAGGLTRYLKFLATSGTNLYYVVVAGITSTGVSGPTLYVRYSDGTDLAVNNSADVGGRRLGVLNITNVIPRDSEDYVIIYSNNIYYDSGGYVISMWG